MKVFLIAELGINHNGDVDTAKELIRGAHHAGFDAVKFQKRAIDVVYTPEFLDGPRGSPWGTTQRAQKEALELSLEQYREIDLYCKDIGIMWSASAWDLESLDFLGEFALPFNKVASPMLGHKPLLRRIAAQGKKTFISTGMSTLTELDDVVDLFRQAACPFELMHCNSTYPMKDDAANLRCIPLLRGRYNCHVGYSGHETSLIKVCVAAVALGATSIERHITLDRAMYGSDQAASIQVRALPNFVDAVRAVPGLLGTGEKRVTDSEDLVRRKLRVDVEEPEPRRVAVA